MRRVEYLLDGQLGRADPRGDRAGLFFTLVAAYPLLDGWIAGGRPPRELLPPKLADPANRIGVGAAGTTFCGLLWAAAANDEIAYHLQIPLYTVTWVFRSWCWPARCSRSR